MNTENSEPTVENVVEAPEATNSQADIEMIDLQYIQVEAVMRYANDMNESMNRTIAQRNGDCVAEADKEFMAKVVERRDFFNKISNICYNALKPHTQQFDNSNIDSKNWQSFRQSEQLIQSHDINKFVSDNQSLDSMETAMMQILHSNINENKVRISSIKVPKVVFTALNLI